MDTRSARSRGVAAVVASMALLGSGAAITASPARAVPPLDDCATGLPVTDVTSGMQVDTLTVTRGNTPQSFAGEVIGVQKDGIAPGVDMILAEFGNQTGDPANDTAIDKVGGIWQGMSGSPVYDGSGNLLGAVAYGLSWGPSTVAGITPYEHMDDYLPGAGAMASLPRSTAREVAAGSEVTVDQAEEGFSPLRVPLTISGIGGQRLSQLRSDERGSYLHTQGRAGNLVGSVTGFEPGDPADIRDGGNLGAAVSYGTVTIGGVGTVTERCEDVVVGFGHPMMFSGSTSLGLMPADALYVQKESLGAPFKVADFRGPVGTITQDRLAGISGAVGETPAEVPITSTVSYVDDDPATPDRQFEGESGSLVAQWHPDVTVAQMLRMHDRAIDAIQPGSETSGATIDLLADGEPLSLEVEDRYVSRYDIAFAGIWSTADLVYVLGRLDGVEITGIETTSAVGDSTDVARLGVVQQRREGGWVAVNRRRPALTSPGDTLTLRAELRSPDGSEWLRQEVRVPAKARGEGRLELTGGGSEWSEGLWEAQTLADVQTFLAEDVRNDEVQTRLSFWAGREIDRRAVSVPQQMVVEGRRAASVVVLR